MHHRPDGPCKLCMTNSCILPDPDIFAIHRTPTGTISRRKRAWWTTPTTKIINCKYVWVWKSASLSCLSGMTRESVLHRHEKALLPVMQKRSLQCGIRTAKKFAMHSCALQCCYDRLLALQVFRPRHICNPQGSRRRHCGHRGRRLRGQLIQWDRISWEKSVTVTHCVAGQARQTSSVMPDMHRSLLS